MPNLIVLLLSIGRLPIHKKLKNGFVLPYRQNTQPSPSLRTKSTKSTETFSSSLNEVGIVEYTVLKT